MQITLHSSTQMEMLFLKEKRGSNKACVIPREEMNHGLSDYLEVSRFLPPPQLPTLSKKKVPVVLLGCLRKDKKKKSVFPFIPRMFLGICSFQASGRQAYFITVHPPRQLVHPGPKFVVSHIRNVTWFWSLSSRPPTLVIKAKPSYLRPWMSLIVSHFRVHQDWDTNRGQKRPR